MSTPTVRRRHLPTEVDTIQWLGDNEADVQAFTGGAAFFFALDDEDRENSDDPEATATVFDCLHSTWILVYTGQHIVRGGRGEHYPLAETAAADDYETVGPGFFQPGHTYADDEHGWKFRVDTITTHPDNGELTALGWRFFNNAWEPIAYHQDDWEVHQAVGHTDVIEAGAS